MWNELEKKNKQVWEDIVSRCENPAYKTLNLDNKFELVQSMAERIFLNLKENAEANGADLLIVNIDTDTISWLSEILSKHKINYFDLSSNLKKASNIHFKIDPHYNRNGHAVIANALKEYLLEKYFRENYRKGEIAYPSETDHNSIIH